jgi:hypothetical protein
MMKHLKIRIPLVVLEVFVALTALVGGIALRSHTASTDHKGEIHNGRSE